MYIEDRIDQVLINSREEFRVALTFNSTILTQGGIVSLVYCCKSQTESKEWTVDLGPHMQCIRTSQLVCYLKQC